MANKFTSSLNANYFKQQTMIIYYAMGSGMGHLVCTQKVLHKLNIREFKIFTASAFASLVFAPDQIIRIPTSTSPEEGFMFLVETIKEYRAKSIFIDTFPFGIRGELDLELLASITQIHYIARYVKWPNYVMKLKLKVPIHNTYIIDILQPVQQAFIDKHSHAQAILDLSEVMIPSNSLLPDIPPNSWLIAHSRPLEEVEELVAFAQREAIKHNVSPHFLLATQTKYETTSLSLPITLIPHYPIQPLFQYVDKIVTACGINIMMETLPFKEKHLFMPFPRRYDDQFLRARLREGDNR